jgi:dTDP-glucose pyrophosphorylase
MKNRKYSEHLISINSTIKSALLQLNELNLDNILFVIDHNEKLVGSLTDGDVRRGLINGFGTDASIVSIIQENPKYVIKGENSLDKIIEFREGNFKIIPLVDKDHRVINIINFRNVKSCLPLDVVIMAGGRGERLRPFTDNIPKPLLKVGSKSILEHNIDNLSLFGIDNFWISLKYLGEQIIQKFGDGQKKNININYVWEEEPLGTVGAVSKINNFQHDYILIMNSDLLTNVDYEKFLLEFIQQDADFIVLSIPYKVNIPYAVLETDSLVIKSLKEKPVYTYYSNGGIYIVKKSLLKYIPYESYFNSTDLIELLIEKKYNVLSYPFSGYWLDIGKHEDFERAQLDIKQLVI